MNQEKVLKGLAIWGVVAIALMIILPGLFIAVLIGRLGDKATEQANRNLTQNQQSQGGLGAEGSACGGVARLPCNPGLECSVALGTADSGTCIKVQDETVSLTVAREGEPCPAGQCDVGLYCKKDTTLCAKNDATSPLISSLKLSGATPDGQGIYQLKETQKYTLTVQAVNVQKVEVQLEGAGDMHKGLGDMTKGQGGKYTFEYKAIPANGLLLIRAIAKNGDISIASLPIATSR